MVWLWATLGWLAASAGAAALFHRLKAADGAVPSGVRSFVLGLENELAKNHPGVEFVELLPDRFACLLSVDGQQTPVSLHRLHEQAAAAPDTLPALVAQLVADLREVALDRVEDLDFARAAELLLPQVRSRSWIEERGRFGDSGMVSRPLGEELAVVYVLDHDSSMVFVCRAHLQRWRKTAEDLHNLAVANLAKRGDPRVDAATAKSQPFVLQTGDGYDAARVLLLRGCDDLLVAMPD
ncbi:MAG: hypothetical protein RL398_2223, partial [Planctomycetota bacterium]